MQLKRRHVAEVIASKRFIDDAAHIQSHKLLAQIEGNLRNIAAFPEIGSKNIPPSVAAEFGESIRLIPINPFDLIYEYDEKADSVIVYGLIHQRTAH